MQEAYTADRLAVLEPYALTDEEAEALTAPDIGKLYVLGVNGQILMHFAAFHQIEWRTTSSACAMASTITDRCVGVYAITGYEGTRAHSESLGQDEGGGWIRPDPRGGVMPLVYAGVCSHAPGIRGRKDLADPQVRDASTPRTTACGPTPGSGAGGDRHCRRALLRTSS